MSELEEFVAQEIELNRKLDAGEMTFRDYMQHIKVSHNKLCQMVRSGGLVERLLNIEVLRGDPGGRGVEVSTFSLPSDCDRIVVDSERLVVNGFRQSATSGSIEQVIGELVSQCVGPLIAGGSLPKS